MKILVCIASYGRRNDVHLHELLVAYAGMSHDVRVVVLSNEPKPLPAWVELRVGLPERNPWSLPFAHREVFIAEKDNYDLFIYSEDDTLITRAHVDAFMSTAALLREDELAGFLRSEEGSDGARYYSTIHSHFHWDSTSVVERSGSYWAHLTNEHGACYMLTRPQLGRAIASGGFSVAPHEGKYDMLVSAATDPYTRCGFRKLLCISDLDRFTCKHLTNRYVGRTGVEQRLVELQVAALLAVARGGLAATLPFHVETSLPHALWSKSYYEPLNESVLELLPASARRVLSVGCGWGANEVALISRGFDVQAVPLDAVIGAVARSRGVRVQPVSMIEAPDRLRGQTFDAIFMSNLLHLSPDPVSLLRRYGAVLARDGVLVVTFPNMAHLAIRIRRLARRPLLRGMGRYDCSGMHVSTPSTVRRWLCAAGFSMTRDVPRFVGRWGRYDRLTMGCARGLWAAEFAVAASKTAVACSTTSTS